ncbi:hypothetical protein UT300002_30430 [Clostridium perfringens]
MYQMYEITNYATKDYIRFYNNVRPHIKYNCKIPAEVITEALNFEFLIIYLIKITEEMKNTKKNGFHKKSAIRKRVTDLYHNILIFNLSN